MLMATRQCERMRPRRGSNTHGKLQAKAIPTHRSVENTVHHKIKAMTAPIQCAFGKDGTVSGVLSSEVIDEDLGMQATIRSQ